MRQCGGTLGSDTSVGPWSKTLEWDSRVCFFNIINYTVFSLSELQEVQTMFKMFYKIILQNI